MNKLICINDKDFPSEIPTSKRLKLGEEYTITKVMKCNVQGGLLGFAVAEIDLTGCAPYEYFAANRFGVPVDIDVLMEEEVEMV